MLLIRSDLVPGMIMIQSLTDISLQISFGYGYGVIPASMIAFPGGSLEHPPGFCRALKHNKSFRMFFSELIYPYFSLDTSNFRSKK